MKKLISLTLAIIAVTTTIWLNGLSPAWAVETNTTTIGKQIFQLNCAACHPQGGNIIRWGKNLYPKALAKNHLDTLENLVTFVANGKGNMPAYVDRLTQDEILAVSNYVLEQAGKKWKG